MIEAGSRCFSPRNLQERIVAHWKEILQSGCVGSMGYKIPTWRQLIISGTAICDTSGILRLSVLDSESCKTTYVDIPNSNGLIDGKRWLKCMEDAATYPLNIRLFLEDIGVVTGLNRCTSEPTKEKILVWPAGC